CIIPELKSTDHFYFFERVLRWTENVNFHFHLSGVVRIGHRDKSTIQALITQTEIKHLN
ncbi:unnamed protein product, partial [Prunus brigantina]